MFDGRLGPAGECAGAEHRGRAAGFSEWHADAARVHDSSRADHPVKLNVGMAADDHGDAESFEDGQEAVTGSEASKDLGVVARCGVAEKDIAEAGNLDLACWRPAF